MDTLSFYRDMLELLPKGDLQALLETAHRYMPFPLLITDATYQLLACFPSDPTGDYYWDYLLQHRKYDAELILELYEDKILQTADTHQQPYLVDWGRAAQDFPKLVGPVQIDGQTEGFVALQYGKGECPPALLEGMRILQCACQILFQQRQPRSNLRTIQQKAFAEELLRGRIHSQAQMRKWQRTIGFSPQGAYLALVMSADPREESTVLSALCRQLEKMFPEQFSLILDQELLMVCCHLQPSAAQQIVQGPFQKLLERFRCQCGVSAVFSDLADTGTHLLQARAALRLGRTGKLPHGTVFPFPRLALLALLFDGVQHTPEANFLHPAIPALAAYDRKHGTDLLTTLRVYVKHLGKSSSTVKELHIHRNSLPYRLGKIQQITGYSLEDFQTVLHLAVNFYWLNWETDDPKRS